MDEGNASIMIIGQKQQWMDAMNGAGFDLGIEDDLLTDTATTRSTSVSIESSLVSQGQGGYGRINGRDANAVKGQHSRKTVNVSPRKIGR